MNKVIIIYAILFAIYSCKPNTENAVKVAEIQTTYLIRPDITIKYKEEYFDSMGNCIQEIYFGSRPGDTVKIVENSYAVTLLLKSIEKNRSGKIQQTTIHHYDNTYLSKKLIVRNNDTTLIKSYTYHDNGNIKREITEFPTGKSTPVINIQNFDIHGNPEKIYDQIYEDSTMLVIGRYEMTSFNNTYDTSTNRLIKVVATKLFGYYEMTDTLFITSYKYDTFGNLISQHNIIKSTKDTPDSIRFEYTDSGLLHARISYLSEKDKSGTNITDSILYEYDAEGQLIAERGSNGLGYRYEFK